MGVFVKRQVSHLEDLGISVNLAVSNIAAHQAVLLKYVSLALHTLNKQAMGCDLVHVHWPVVPGILGWFIARLRRIPLVVTIHGGEIDPDEVYTLEMGHRKREVTRSIARWVLRHADRVIVVGDYLAETVRRLGVSIDRIAVINMGVDTEQFQPRPRAEARGRLGLDSSALILVAVGALVLLKGHTYLLMALKTILESQPSCRLYLIGAGGMVAELKALGNELGILDHVVFVGPRPSEEIPWWMSAADVVVMPSLAEASGLAALEALACGTPVVASRVGGLLEQISDGENGFLVPPKNPLALAQRIDQLLSNPSLRRDMQAQCVISAQRYDGRTQARKVIEVYESLMVNGCQRNRES